MQAEAQRRIQETEKKLKELPHLARQHKVFEHVCVTSLFPLSYL